MANIVTVTIPLSVATLFNDPAPNHDMTDLQRAAAVQAKLATMTAFFTNPVVTPQNCSFDYCGSIVVTSATPQPASNAAQVYNLILLVFQGYFVVGGNPTYNFVPDTIAQQLDRQVTQENANIQAVKIATSPYEQLIRGNVVGALGMGVKELANLAVGNPYDQGIAGGDNPDQPAAFDWSTVAIYAGIGLGIFILIKAL
jgi:hypothetical protein